MKLFFIWTHLVFKGQIITKLDVELYIKSIATSLNVLHVISTYFIAKKGIKFDYLAKSKFKFSRQILWSKSGLAF